MRDHCKTIVWTLGPNRIDDVIYSDTLFSSIVSVRGYTYFQIFAYKYSTFEKIELMCRDDNTSEKYEDVVISISASNTTEIYNTRVLT